MFLKRENFPLDKILFKACFVLGLLVIEQVALVGAILLLYRNTIEKISIEHYIYSLPSMVAASILLMDYFKLSNFQRKPVQVILTNNFKYISIFLAIVCIYAYLLNLYALPRYALVLGGSFFYVLLTIWVVINQKFSMRLYKKGSLLIVADDEADAARIMKKIQHEASSLNFKIIGCVKSDEVIGLHDLFIKSSDVLISSTVSEKTKFEILILCSKYNKLVYLVPSFYDLSFSKYRIVKFYDTPTFEIENRGLTFQQLLLKRIFDVVFSSVILLLTSPVFLLIAILIKLDSKGPVFYAQDRVTYQGYVYKVFKFRTMVSDAEKIYGAYQASENDQRITRVGKILRNMHLDELPQFVNVILGSMSVVGPRSDRTISIETINKQTVGYDYRLKVKSGITGMAQLFGKYDTDPEDKLRYDVYYIKNYSLLFDLQLILLTVIAMFPKKNSYNDAKSKSDYFVKPLDKS